MKPGPTLNAQWTAEGGYVTARQLLKEFPGEYTAIFAGNDLIAQGALLALHESKIRVPEEISIIGFDGMEEAQYFYPPLSTVTLDFGVLGNECLETLLQVINGTTDQNIRKVSRPRLLVRQSTAAPPSAKKERRKIPPANGPAATDRRQTQ